MSCEWQKWDVINEVQWQILLLGCLELAIDPPTVCQKQELMIWGTKVCKKGEIYMHEYSMWTEALRVASRNRL